MISSINSCIPVTKPPMFVFFSILPRPTSVLETPLRPDRVWPEHVGRSCERTPHEYTIALSIFFIGSFWKVFWNSFQLRHFLNRPCFYLFSTPPELLQERVPTVYICSSFSFPPIFQVRLPPASKNQPNKNRSIYWPKWVSKMFLVGWE